MKKESFIAVLLGVGAGVTIAILLITNSKSKNADSKKIISPAVTPTVAIVQEQIFSLNIKSPANNSSTTKDSITITGSAPKNSLIVINSATGDKTFKTEKENFKTDFPLSLGENAIYVTAYSQKNSASKTLKIYNLGSE